MFVAICNRCTQSIIFNVFIINKVITSNNETKITINCDIWLSKEEEFDFGGFNIDEPITWVKSKRSGKKIWRETKFSHGGKRRRSETHKF